MNYFPWLILFSIIFLTETRSLVDYNGNGELHGMDKLEQLLKQSKENEAPVDEATKEQQREYARNMLIKQHRLYKQQREEDESDNKQNLNDGSHPFSYKLPPSGVVFGASDSEMNRTMENHKTTTEENDILKIQKEPSSPLYNFLLPSYFFQTSNPKTSNQSPIIYLLVILSMLAVPAVLIFAIFRIVRQIRKGKGMEDIEYPTYGVTGPSNKDHVPNTDRQLAESAQMYHYQQQKHQITEASKSERVSPSHDVVTVIRNPSDSSEEDDFTVYECPGLATMGEMEVTNPMFQEEDNAKEGKKLSPKKSQDTKPAKK